MGWEELVRRRDGVGEGGLGRGKGIVRVFGARIVRIWERGVRAGGGRAGMGWGGFGVGSGVGLERREGYNVQAINTLRQAAMRTLRQTLGRL